MPGTHLLVLVLTFLGISACLGFHIPPPLVENICVQNDLVWNFTAADEWFLLPDTDSKNCDDHCKVEFYNSELVEVYNISFKLKVSTCDAQSETDWVELGIPTCLGALGPPSDPRTFVKNLCQFTWKWGPPANDSQCDVEYLREFKVGSEDWQFRETGHKFPRFKLLNQNNNTALRVKATQFSQFSQEMDWVQFNLQPSDVTLPNCRPYVSLKQQCSSDWKKKLDTAGYPTCNFTFKMQVKSGDTENWMDYDSKLYTLQPSIHKNGTSLRVKAILNCNVSRESDWAETKFPSKGEPSFKNVECIKYSPGYMNCTWEADNTLSPKIKYGLKYWHKELTSIQNCSHPITTGDVVTGCHLDKGEMEDVDEMCLEVFGEDSKVNPAFQILQIIEIAKPSTPSLFIQWNETERLLSLSYRSEPTDISEMCLEYQVGYKDSKSNTWRTYDDLWTETIFPVPSFDSSLKYTFRVRARYSNTCRDKKAQWSDWSEEAEFGNLK
ncbi:interleukin-13 receptor subunit alpha-2-like [Protopterus annectens]|uniref:interleukin-13 receptor subunit alpha-2-like n=1 Tax=Protopterus annectens TaxID=7888 RepID=UPI001CF97CAA|nr:interleukin-13 receptor subunit alpha-2-like [Protopterus annectens]